MLETRNFILASLHKKTIHSMPREDEESSYKLIKMDIPITKNKWYLIPIDIPETEKWFHWYMPLNLSSEEESRNFLSDILKVNRRRFSYKDLPWPEPRNSPPPSGNSIADQLQKSHDEYNAFIQSIISLLKDFETTKKCYLEKMQMIQKEKNENRLLCVLEYNPDLCWNGPFTLDCWKKSILDMKGIQRKKRNKSGLGLPQQQSTNSLFESATSSPFQSMVNNFNLFSPTQREPVTHSLKYSFPKPIKNDTKHRKFPAASGLPFTQLLRSIAGRSSVSSSSDIPKLFNGILSFPPSPPPSFPPPDSPPPACFEIITIDSDSVVSVSSDEDSRGSPIPKFNDFETLQLDRASLSSLKAKSTATLLQKTDSQVSQNQETSLNPNINPMVQSSSCFAPPIADNKLQSERNLSSSTLCSSPLHIEANNEKSPPIPAIIIKRKSNSSLYEIHSIQNSSNNFSKSQPKTPLLVPLETINENLIQNKNLPKRAKQFKDSSELNNSIQSSLSDYSSCTPNQILVEPPKTSLMETSDEKSLTAGNQDLSKKPITQEETQELHSKPLEISGKTELLIPHGKNSKILQVQDPRIKQEKLQQLNQWYALQPRFQILKTESSELNSVDVKSQILPNQNLQQKRLSALTNDDVDIHQNHDSRKIIKQEDWQNTVNSLPLAYTSASLIPSLSPPATETNYPTSPGSEILSCPTSPIINFRAENSHFTPISSPLSHCSSCNLVIDEPSFDSVPEEASYGSFLPHKSFPELCVTQSFLTHRTVITEMRSEQAKNSTT